MGKRLAGYSIVFAVCALAFWAGFRSGEIYHRSKAKVAVEKVMPSNFYVVEEHDYGTYKSVDFFEADRNSPVIKFFMNPNLRPLLKLRKLQIYDEHGNKVY